MTVPAAVQRTPHLFKVGATLPWRGRNLLIVGLYGPDSLVVPEGQTGYTAIVDGSFERVTVLQSDLIRQGRAV